MKQKRLKAKRYAAHKECLDTSNAAEKLLCLSPADAELLLKMLENPPEPNEALQRAMARYRARFGDDTPRAADPDLQKMTSAALRNRDRFPVGAVTRALARYKADRATA